MAKLDPPRAAWVMVPAGIAGKVVEALAGLMEPGDVVIDGGNSYYRDDVRRAEALAAKGLHYLDVGTSGGVFGLERGYCLMIGGEADVVARLDPLFRALAPGLERPGRTPGREGDGARGARLPSLRAGRGRHFVKMVHGIEYGIMAAYAEGLNILRKANVGKHTEEANAEAPPARPGFYRYDLDVAAVAEVWRRGSVIGSWLLDLTAHALAQDPTVAGFSGAGVGLGRGPLDGGGGRGDRGARPCAHHRPVPAVRLRGGRLRRAARRPCARSSAVTRSSPPVSDPGGAAALRMGTVDGEPAVTLAAGELEATFLPGLGLLGTALRHRGEDLLALPGEVAGYQDRHVTGLPLLAPWANRLPAWRYRAAGVEVDLEGLDLPTDPGGLPIHGT